MSPQIRGELSVTILCLQGSNILCKNCCLQLDAFCFNRINRQRHLYELKDWKLAREMIQFVR